ncbi:MAG: carbohydrate ABC transporter permease [Phycisphaerae bacterium]
MQDSKRDAAPAAGPRPGGASWQVSHRRKGWLFVAPALVLFALMIAYPIGRSFYLSFFDYSILEPDSSRFVGLDNYEKLFTQSPNRLPFSNTMYFTAVFTPPYVILALAVAMMLNACRRGTVVLRTLIFAPVVVSLAVSAVMWTLFYNPSFGMAHQMLQGAVKAINNPLAFGWTLLLAWVAALAAIYSWRRFARVVLHRPAQDVSFAATAGGAAAVALIAVGLWWMLSPDSAMILSAGALPGVEIASAPAAGMLGDSHWAMIAIAVMCVWNGVGINIILFLVGLQRIPDELYEAGMVDGAGAWRRFTGITLPQLWPTMYLVVLLSLIGAFKVFGQPFIMTLGGPEDSTLTFVMRMYNLAFKYGKFELGYASALAYALGLFILVFSLLMRRLNRPVE